MIRLLTQSDKQIIMEYLGRNEIGTSFLYANIVEFGVDNKRDIRRCADYYGFFEGEELKGILPFYNLGSCIPHYETEAAVPLFAGIMRERSFKFLLGMREIVKPLYDEIEAYKEIQAYDESAYFVNKSFKPYVLDGIDFIDARGAGNDAVVDFVINAREKGFNEIMTREDAIKSLVQRSEEEDFIIAVKAGEMVAQACIQTYTPGISQIGRGERQRILQSSRI